MSALVLKLVQGLHASVQNDNSEVFIATAARPSLPHPLHRPLSLLQPWPTLDYQTFMCRLAAASVGIDSALYLLTISSPDIDNVAISLYDIMCKLVHMIGRNHV